MRAYMRIGQALSILFFALFIVGLLHLSGLHHSELINVVVSVLLSLV